MTTLLMANGPISLKDLIISVSFLWAALLCKEIAVMVPMILLTGDLARVCKEF